MSTKYPKNRNNKIARIKYHIVMEITLVHCIAKRIQSLLKERGWTYYKLSIESFVPPQTISTIINEKTRSANTETLYFIAKALGMNLSQFFDDPIFDLLDIEKK